MDRALIEAAIEELGESGYAAFTTSAVAHRAGASTASLYRRWSSKHELTAAVARQIALDELGEVDTGALEGDILELLARKQRVLDANAGPALLSLMGHAAHSPELRRILHDEVYLATRGRLAAIIDRAAERRELERIIPANEVDLLALVLIGTGLARSAFMANNTIAGPPHPPRPIDQLETESRLLLLTIRSRPHEEL
ncbi:TetR/AcrR family transcriptional regulator [Nocardia sp. NPDC004123]